MKSLKKILIAFTLIIAFIFLANITTVKAEEVKAIYTVESVMQVKANGAPIASKATYSSTYSKPYQLTKDNFMTLKLSGYTGTTIKGITLSMRCNSGGGGGYLSVTAGTTTIAKIGDAENGVAFKNDLWNGAISTEFVDVNVTLENDSYTIGNEEITIIIGATASSLYCQKYTILYEDGEETNPVILPFKSLNTLASLRINYVESDEKSNNYYSYHKCETQNDWTGRYLIVYEPDKIALDGSLTAEDKLGDTFRINTNIKGNYIYLKENKGYVDIQKYGNGYSIKTQSGLYVGGSSASSASYKLKTEPIENSITPDGKIYYPNSEYYLQYNSGTSSLIMKYYKGTQKDVALYKLVAYENVSESTYEIEDFSIKFSITIPSSVYNSITALDNFEEVGIDITSTSSKLPKISSSVAQIGDKTVYNMTLSEMTKADLDTIYKAQAYVKVNNKCYYAKETAYTIRELAKYYDYNMRDDSEVTDYIGILRYITALK